MNQLELEIIKKALETVTESTNAIKEIQSVYEISRDKDRKYNIFKNIFLGIIIILFFTLWFGATELTTNVDSNGFTRKECEGKYE